MVTVNTLGVVNAVATICRTRSDRAMEQSCAVDKRTNQLSHLHYSPCRYEHRVQRVLVMLGSTPPDNTLEWPQRTSSCALKRKARKRQERIVNLCRVPAHHISFLRCTPLQHFACRLRPMQECSGVSLRVIAVGNKMVVYLGIENGQQGHTTFKDLMSPLTATSMRALVCTPCRPSMP